MAEKKQEREGLLQRLFGNEPIGQFYLGVYATIMAIWLIASVSVEFWLGNVSSVYGATRHIMDEGADKVAFISSITVLVSEGGPAAMVMGAYEKYVAGPRREDRERADRAEKELSEERARLMAWNERRLQAEELGEPFDEPFPSYEDTEEA